MKNLQVAEYQVVIKINMFFTAIFALRFQVAALMLRLFFLGSNNYYD